MNLGGGGMPELVCDIETEIEISETIYVLGEDYKYIDSTLDYSTVSCTEEDKPDIETCTITFLEPVEVSGWQANVALLKKPTMAEMSVCSEAADNDQEPYCFSLPSQKRIEFITDIIYGDDNTLFKINSLSYTRHEMEDNNFQLISYSLCVSKVELTLIFKYTSADENAPDSVTLLSVKVDDEIYYEDLEIEKNADALKLPVYLPKSEKEVKIVVESEIDFDAAISSTPITPTTPQEVPIDITYTPPPED